MKLHKSACSASLESNIEELNRRRDLESLRPFVITEQCFLPHKDVNTAAITMEELKKLARAWKLHERRNFWKTHTERDQMVAVLLQHIEETRKVAQHRSTGAFPPVSDANLTGGVSTSQSVNANSTAGSVAVTTGGISQSIRYSSPVPPPDPRSSSKSRSPKGKGAVTFSTRPGFSTFMTNYCGMKYYFKILTSEELVTTSRHIIGPDVDNSVEVIVNNWRSEDFELTMEQNDSKMKKNLFQPSGGADAAAKGLNLATNKKKKAMNSKVRLMKHRNLSAHLAFYSASDETSKSNLTMQAVQTFVTISETDDPVVASNCFVAISNIAGYASVRNKLLEMNAVHKYSSLLPLVKDPTGMIAAATLFYYLSCESEIEDRIYNSSISILPTNCVADSEKLRHITLYTLCNLAPSIDRPRTAELVMQSIRVYFSNTPDNNKISSEVCNIFLRVLINVCAFTNAHTALFAGDILDVLSTITYHAVTKKEKDIGLNVAKIVLSLFHSYDVNASHFSTDLAGILTDLFKFDDERILRYAMRAVLILSALHATLDVASDSELVSVVVLCITVQGNKIPADVAKDAAKYLFNITRSDDAISLENLVSMEVASAILQLMKFGASQEVVKKPQPQLVKRVSMIHNLGQSFAKHGGDNGNLQGDDRSQKQMQDVSGNNIVSDSKSSGADASSSSMKRDKVEQIAVRGLQNLLSIRVNCIKIADACFDELVRMVTELNDLGAALSLYNISCVPECEEAMYRQKIHLKVLNSLCNANLKVKAAYLKVLVRMSNNPSCVQDVIEGGLIAKLVQEIKSPDTAEVWDSVARMLLAVVSLRKSSPVGVSGDDEKGDVEGNEETINGIIKILKTICTKKSSPAVVLESSMVLTHISMLVKDLFDINPLIHTIVNINHLDDAVMDNMAMAIYNLTCNDKLSQALLKDSTYLNIMIRLMRQGKQICQQNIAEAIRNLTSYPRCAELFQNDLLSDLIVIALLRTSSTDIQIVCAHSFFNMLCHPDTRPRLLRGDFWWGMMRLSKCDSISVRETFARTLFDLSCGPQNVAALRAHNIFSFVKDIAAMSEVPVLEAYVFSIQNLVSHIQSSIDQALSAGEDTAQYALSSTEVVSLIRLSIDTLGRSKNLASIRTALALLVICSEQGDMGAEAELVNREVDFVLSSCLDIWSGDATESCLLVSKLLWQLSKSATITNSIALADMGKLLYATYEGSSTCPQAIEISDNIVSILLQYALRYNPDPESILDLPVFNMILCDILRIPRSEGASSKARAALPHSSLTTRQNMVALYSFVVNKAVENPEIISSGLVMGLMDPELILSHVSRNHILAIMVAFSTKPNLAKYAVDGKMLKVLTSYIAANHKKGGKVNVAAEYASVIIRNLSLHHATVLPQIVSSASSGLSELIQTIIKEEVLSPATATNLSIVFYKASANYILKHEFPLSPRFVLDSIQHISDLLEEYECEGRQEITTTNKFIIGIVLDKYSHGMNIEPTFIQSMYLELTSPRGVASSRSIPQEMADLQFETALSGLSLSLTDQLLSAKMNVKLMVSLSLLPAVANQWKPVVVRTKKRMVVQSGSYKTDNLLEEPPAVEMYLENAEPFPLDPFEKVVHSYPCLSIDEEMLNATTLIEETEEDNGEDDEEAEADGEEGELTTPSGEGMQGSDAATTGNRATGELAGTTLTLDDTNLTDGPATTDESMEALFESGISIT